MLYFEVSWFTAALGWHNGIFQCHLYLMLLTELSIANYKSFFEKKQMRFGPGFNVLLGANSSGKTTVLEAIRFRDIPDIPHRSIANLTEVDTRWVQVPEVTTRFEMPLTNLQKIVSDDGLSVVLSDNNGVLLGGSVQNIEQYWREHNFAIELSQEGSKVPEAYFYPCGERSKKRGENWTMGTWRANVGISGVGYPANPIGFEGTDHRNDIEHVAQRIHEKIYRFSAERVLRPTCPASESELKPDASNLAFCINHLRSTDDSAFDRLNSYLHRIFSNIHGVAAIPLANGSFELYVHTLPRSANRSDLAVPMSRVGTGVSNAIAMLYVVLTARTPRIILLEEPNSYLHPRALRELLAILAEAGAMHQFFVTTHSSDVLRCVRASTVTLLQNDGIQTTVQQTLQNELKSFHAGLLDLGIRLTDLHGCDRVLWVEGETEEAIFPKVLEHFFPHLAQGTAVLRLHATGDFESRKFRAEKVAGIYRRLSTATFLAPPMVAITLDREGKPASQVESLEREGEGVVYMLPRAMIEDYLLLPEAIVSVMRDEYGSDLDSATVQAAIDKARKDSSNFISAKVVNNPTLHAAKLLKSVFRQLGGEGADYDKAKHGPMLAQWILAERPQEFEELKAWFSKFIEVSPHH